MEQGSPGAAAHLTAKKTIIINGFTGAQEYYDTLERKVCFTCIRHPGGISAEHWALSSGCVVLVRAASCNFS